MKNAHLHMGLGNRGNGEPLNDCKNAANRGSALLLVTVLVSTLMVMAGVIVNQVAARHDVTLSFNRGVNALYAADAGIEQAKYNIRASAYDANGNVWLNANSSTSGYEAISNLQIGNTSVDVVITSVGGEWCEIKSTSTLSNGQTKTVAVEAKGRDLFSKYMFFIHLDSINIGTTSVRGDVHANRSVNFYYGGAKMYGNVTAVTGIGYYSGASVANTTFYKDVDGGAATIAWPNTNEIATLENSAVGVYEITNDSPFYSGFGSFNTELEFLGNQVKITAKRPSNGQILSQGTYPLPANGLIFVQGAITSMKGDINGRTTVACMNTVSVTGKIRYVDDQGDPAYRLYDANGAPVADTGNGVVWQSPTYNYLANPDYNPTTPSTLGVLALNDVVITAAAPYNMEMHAALFASQGRWYCDLTQYKGNLRVLGSMTQKYGGWRYSGSTGKGWAMSGEYIYDQNLLTYPPPFYLRVDSPVFSSWRRM